MFAGLRDSSFGASVGSFFTFATFFVAAALDFMLIVVLEFVFEFFFGLTFEAPLDGLCGATFLLRVVTLMLLVLALALQIGLYLGLMLRLQATL